MGKRLSRLSLSDFIEILKHSWTISATISNVATCRFESNFAFRVVPFAVRLNHSCSPNCQQSWDEESGNLATSQLQDLLPNLNFKDAMDMHILCMHHAMTSSFFREGKALCHDKDSARSRALSLGKMSKKHSTFHLYIVYCTVYRRILRLVSCEFVGDFDTFDFCFDLVVRYGTVQSVCALFAVQWFSRPIPKKSSEIFYESSRGENTNQYNQWKDWFVVACKSTFDSRGSAALQRSAKVSPIAICANHAKRDARSCGQSNTAKSYAKLDLLEFEVFLCLRASYIICHTRFFFIYMILHA